ncbi:MAG: hypothetical protein IPM55_20955 [Acidobacteria bacterium]|nr:hypothetical protein [Acidobacteriota bacterium]
MDEPSAAHFAGSTDYGAPKPGASLGLTASLHPGLHSMTRFAGRGLVKSFSNIIDA